MGLSRFDFDWHSWAPASCMPDDCFCELIRKTSTVWQWANSWSNFSFVFVGVMMWGSYRATRRESEHARNFMNDNPLFSATYIIAVVLIGLTSWFYHASLSFVGQWFDNQSMYLLALYIIFYNLTRSQRMRPESFLYAYLWANIAFGILQLYFPEARRFMFAGLLVLALVSEVLIRLKQKPQIHSNYLWGALGSIIAAYVIWVLDREKILCEPASLLQGHAVWHMLCALSAWFMFIYFSSEEKNTKLRKNHVG